MDMPNTMAVDHEIEAQIAEETGHLIECFEVWMETALESGVPAAEIYELWRKESAAGFPGQYGKCTCDDYS